MDLPDFRAQYGLHMKSLFALVAISIGIVQAEDAIVSKIAVPPVAGQTLWRVSVATLATANALDIHSSWGKYELNPALSNRNGQFGRDGTLLKVSILGGLLGVEYLITRRHPPNRKLYRALSFINFGASAAVAGTAIHNYHVPRPR
jgi:hypothetical protein